MPRQAVGTFDIDGVLARYLDALLLWHNREYGTRLRLCDITDCALSNVVGCSAEEERHRIERFERSNAVHRIKPETGYEHVIALSYACTLALVTSRPDGMKPLTRDWVTEVFGDAFIGIYHACRDGSGPAADTKARICKALGARFHVDDSLEQAIAVAREGIAVVLYGDVPYNKAPIPHGLRIVRRHDLKSTTDYIRRMFL